MEGDGIYAVSRDGRARLSSRGARCDQDRGRSHLASFGLVGAKVTVTLEIEADMPSGAPDHVVRTMTKNSQTLNFTIQGFEKE